MIGCMQIPFKAVWPAFMLLILTSAISGCSTEETRRFERIPPSQSGVYFENVITMTDSVNAYTDPYIFNGGGVGVGDLNNDGFQDLVVTGTFVNPRIYLNRGNFQFDDITEPSGITTDRRLAGIAIADINSDGFEDIYFSASGAPWSTPEDRKNLLFINNGDSTFSERAGLYNLDDPGYGIQAAFFDYDRDGDLDVFQLNNSPDEFSRGGTGSASMGGSGTLDPYGLDQLYRNNGDGTFTKVSEEAGIVRTLGFGLGIAISDLNGDGWPDFYISNDATPNDVLYVNNGDGSFSNRASDWIKHSSYSGMGIDIADFDNNDWPDILQTDMIPEDLTDRKRMTGKETYTAMIDRQRNNIFPYYNMNALQLNHGISSKNDVIFSEISRLAGVSYTHWSWSVLFADFDNDGWKDAFVSNGFPKAGMDYDHQANIFKVTQNTARQSLNVERFRLLQDLHSFDAPNYLFRNNSDLTFSNISASWGLAEPGLSYGAAYADLDNDGRLDLIINNINDPIWIYRNRGDDIGSEYYLKIELKGSPFNRSGLGSKVKIWINGDSQYRYQNPYRGYQSSVDKRLHFGLGETTLIDSLAVIWPDGKRQILQKIAANQTIILNHTNAGYKANWTQDIQTVNQKRFEKFSANSGIDWQHQSETYVDYNIQPLLPYMISRQGPVMATADVNGDGLEDLFVSGSADQGGSLYLQQEDGRFTETTAPQPWRADAGHRDWGAAFFDANGDGLPDLYLAAGSYQTSPVSPLLQDRLYLNYGGGRFLRDEQALPPMLTATSAVSAADFDGDGDTDLFVGGRLTPRDYPTPARSYLLRNDGGRFTDVTQQMLPSLADPGGMVTDARWSDLNGDGDPDLIVAGEWMPIRVFLNRDGAFEEQTESIDAPSRGWWYSLQAADLDGDGDEDLVAGNLGLNHTYTASPESPFGVVAADLTGNRTTDIILTKTLEGTEYPLYGLAKLGRDIYTVGIRYGSFAEFAEQSVEQVAGREAMEQALHYHTDTFASVWLENDGQGAFTMHRLPNLAQIAPVMDIVVEDADGDGHPDLIIAGNLYQSEPTAPRADAGKGLWLRGDGQGGFTPVSPTRSGLLAPGDVKELSLIRTAGGPILLVGSENEDLQLFKINSAVE